VLAYSSTTILPAANNSAMTVDKLCQEFDILVVNVHRARTLAFDKKRILLFDLSPGASSLAGSFFRIERATTERHAKSCQFKTQGKTKIRDFLSSYSELKNVTRLRKWFKGKSALFQNNLT